MPETKILKRSAPQEFNEVNSLLSSSFELPQGKEKIITEQTEQKICPLLSTMFPNICKDRAPKTCTLTSCIGNKCAHYVKVQKPAFLCDRIFDPENYYQYEGCGLVHVIPWELVKRPERRAQQ